jgi:TM2 domain-containing membrane protein YozV
MLISGIAMFLLTNIGLHSAYASHVLPALLLLGVGLGMVFASAFALGTLGVAAHDSGVASATINVMQQVGGSVGTALLNTIAASAATTYATSHLGEQPKLLAAHAAISSYTTSFWWAAGIFVLGAVVSAIALRPGLPQMDPEATGGVVL